MEKASRLEKLALICRVFFGVEKNNERENKIMKGEKTEIVVFNRAYSKGLHCSSSSAVDHGLLRQHQRTSKNARVSCVARPFLSTRDRLSFARIRSVFEQQGRALVVKLENRTSHFFTIWGRLSVSYTANARRSHPFSFVGSL